MDTGDKEKVKSAEKLKTRKDINRDIEMHTQNKNPHKQNQNGGNPACFTLSMEANVCHRTCVYSYQFGSHCLNFILWSSLLLSLN